MPARLRRPVLVLLVLAFLTVGASDCGGSDSERRGRHDGRSTRTKTGLLAPQPQIPDPIMEDETGWNCRIDGDQRCRRITTAPPRHLHERELTGNADR